MDMWVHSHTNEYELNKRSHYIYAFQSDSHCISRYTYTFLSVLVFPGNRTHARPH